MPLLSIIIPAYNAAGHIDRCLGSIIKSMKNTPQQVPVEIIVVNDGSIDDTAEKVNSYINEFKGKLILINKENNGVSSARNCGINRAKGEYYYFMDADDEISESFFTIILPLLERRDKDIFIFGFTVISDDKKTNYTPQKTKELLNQFLLGRQRIAIWSIVCHKSLFEDIMFDENTYYAEDIEVISKILFIVKNVGIINLPLYIYYIDNPASAMHKKITEKNLTSISAHQRIFHFLKIHGADSRVLRSSSNLMLSRYYLWREKVMKTNNPELILKLGLFEELKNVRPYLQFNKFYFYNLISYYRCRFFSFFK